MQANDIHYQQMASFQTAISSNTGGRRGRQRGRWGEQQQQVRGREPAAQGPRRRRVPRAKKGDEVLADVMMMNPDGSLRISASFKGVALAGTLREVRFPYPHVSSNTSAQ